MGCKNFLHLTKYSRNIDKYAWKLPKTKCGNLSWHISVRQESFFNNLKKLEKYVNIEPIPAIYYYKKSRYFKNGN